jgi:NAD(P)-dependent dehydrogenase (short-subunit alcohol dehydrogenase family)
MRFRDKVVVVIGGNSGIGLASAVDFAREGGHVVITGRNPDTLTSATHQIGHDVLAIRSDSSDLRAIDELMATIKQRHGRIDVLFVNAGMGAFVEVEEVTEALWDEVMDVNLKGVFFTVQKALPLMQKGGAIVLTSSIGWLKGLSMNSVYAASKAGVRSLGRSFAAALVERGIRVNVVSPGPIQTPITGRTVGVAPDSVEHWQKVMADVSPMKRMGRPGEVASAVLFLACDESSYITGTDMLVDAGLASF